MPDQPTPKPRRGCLFYGCLTGVVCLVAILIAFLLGLHLFKKMLNEYTDTKPMLLPAVQMAPAQIEQLQRRVDAFRDAVRAGRPAPPLELSSDEINALIANEPDFRGLHNRLYVTLEGDKVKGQVSFPMGRVGLPLFHGRYLNGTGTLSVSLKDGLLRIIPQEILVKGKPLPSVYMDRIQSENLATQANDNPHSAETFSQLQSIEIKDSKLIIVPKPKQ
ncbi:MAG TPA: hypothetical protein VNZ64_17555 [Candidatus Acidoferrum sp.]|jgi:hypothetical protein|nr:hypothetical protein [Candidatus Acidoferrum sp.]